MLASGFKEIPNSGAIPNDSVFLKLATETSELKVGGYILLS